MAAVGKITWSTLFQAVPVLEETILGSQDSYIVTTAQILEWTALVWIWLPCCLGHARPLAPHSLNPPTSCQGYSAYSVSPPAFSTCSRILLKYPSLYTKSLFPQVHFRNRNERTKSTWGCRSFRSSWNKKSQHSHSYSKASYKTHRPMQTLKHAITSCYASFSCVYSVLLHWTLFPFI